jgi:hypothetical protein
MTTFPQGDMSRLKTFSSQFPKVLGGYSSETWSDEDIHWIALIMPFPGSERN